mmetsp:Transcript_86367/g.143092  ORF Transcript_86367/g.143092 Transcript_86367/m.143092 type:complete len:241 (-) Transcript_86367:1058-1780(-)
MELRAPQFLLQLRVQLPSSTQSFGCHAPRTVTSASQSELCIQHSLCKAIWQILTREPPRHCFRFRLICTPSSSNLCCLGTRLRSPNSCLCVGLNFFNLFLCFPACRLSCCIALASASLGSFSPSFNSFRASLCGFLSKLGRHCRLRGASMRPLDSLLNNRLRLSRTRSCPELCFARCCLSLLGERTAPSHSHLHGGAKFSLLCLCFSSQCPRQGLRIIHCPSCHVRCTLRLLLRPQPRRG